MAGKGKNPFAKKAPPFGAKEDKMQDMKMMAKKKPATKKKK
jgi:hypothetical protein